MCLEIFLKSLSVFFRVIILPLFYVHSFKGAPQGLKQLLFFFKQIRGIPAFYMLAVALYLLPNLLAAVLFLFPMLRRWIENSNWHIVRFFFLWLSQVLMSYTLTYLTISFHGCKLNDSVGKGPLLM